MRIRFDLLCILAVSIGLIAFFLVWESTRYMILSRPPSDFWDSDSLADYWLSGLADFGNPDTSPAIAASIYLAGTFGILYSPKICLLQAPIVAFYLLAWPLTNSSHTGGIGSLVGLSSLAIAIIANFHPIWIGTEKKEGESDERLLIIPIRKKKKKDAEI